MPHKGDANHPTNEIAEFVEQQPLFCAHSHIRTVQDWGKTPRDLRSLDVYARGDLVSASGVRDFGETSIPRMEDPDFARRYFELWRQIRFTGYGKATEQACRDLLGMEFREENAEAIGEAIGKLIGDDPRESYCRILHEKANLRWMSRDPINMPDEITDESLPDEFIRSSYRDDKLLTIRSRTDVIEREERWKRSLHSVGDLVRGLNDSISFYLATGKLTAFKIGVAYKRDLAFGEPTRHEAEKAFNKLMNVVPGEYVEVVDAPTVNAQSRVSSEELRPLQDYLVHQFVRRAEEEDLLVQVHTGYLAGNNRVLCNIRAMALVPFMLRYPRVRFDLFHAGWPYTEEHATIGKNIPNAYLDLCWMWAMNPVTAENALDSWLACVPFNKIVAYGGDISSPILEYGYARQARCGIGRVLQRWIDRGDMTLDDSKEVAEAIMLENPCKLHKLEP